MQAGKRTASMLQQQQEQDEADGAAAPAPPAQGMIVAVRIRPLSAEEVAAGKCSCCRVVRDGRVVAISKNAVQGTYLRSQQGAINEYAFDHAFDSDATQEEVYAKTAKPFVLDVLDGTNVTVFAYGATGAGKTHTMMGSERGPGAREGEAGAGRVTGIVPQALVDVFAGVELRRAAASRRSERWAVRVSYLEVYNEQILDLLEPSGRPLRINEDAARGVVVVAGLAESVAESFAEVLELLRRGNAHRKTEATMANAVSSRSHAVLQVTVVRSYVDEAGNDVSHEGKLSLIDLAGSERASATNNTGALLRQGASINRSLLSLANCINALAANGRRGHAAGGGSSGGGGGEGVAAAAAASAGGAGNAGRLNVKYRDSKLTHLLKSSLEGKCRLVMVANVNPSHHTFDDSHNTLKYANRAKQIKVDPRVAVEVKEASWPQREARLTRDNRELREANEKLVAEVDRLREALAAPAASSSSCADCAGGRSSLGGGSSATASSRLSLAALVRPSPVSKRGQDAHVAGGSSSSSSSGGAAEEKGGTAADGLVAMGSPPKRRRLDADAGAGGGSPDTDMDETLSACGHAKVVAAAVPLATPEMALAGPLARQEEQQRILALDVRVRELSEGRAVMLQLIDEMRARKEEAEAAAIEERTSADECLRALAKEEKSCAELRAELASMRRENGDLQRAVEERDSLLGRRREAAAARTASAAAAAAALARQRDTVAAAAAANASAAAGDSSQPQGASSKTAAAAGLPAAEATFAAAAAASPTAAAAEAAAVAQPRSKSAATRGCSSARRAVANENDEEGGNAVAAADGLASAMKRQRGRRGSMIPRPRKSMLPAPTGLPTPRRLADISNTACASNANTDSASAGPANGTAGAASGNGGIAARTRSRRSLLLPGGAPAAYQGMR